MEAKGMGKQELGGRNMLRRTEIPPPTEVSVSVPEKGLKYTRQSLYQRLARALRSKVAFGLGLTTAISVGGFVTYQNIPAIHQSVDTLGQALADRWSSLFDNVNIKGTVAPSGIPEFQPSVPSEYITPETTNLTPQELAEEAGFKIIWMDPNDKSGRTVFYDNRGDWGGGIGESYGEQKGTDGKSYRYLVFLTGQFVKFESIGGTVDKYIIMKNPTTGDLLPKIRVDFEGKLGSTEGKQPTILSVANLSLDNEHALSMDINGRLGYMPQWSVAQLGKVLKPGDAVGIGITAVKGISTNVLSEEDDAITANYDPYFAASITVRRFGGKAQIEKELLASD
jgi:hypothetical protein